MKRTLFLILLLLLPAAACAFSGRAQPTLVPTIALPTSTIRIVTLTPIPSRTPTAPRIIPITASSPTPAPDLTPGGRAMPPGVANILVLGSDARGGSGNRTDVIMLVSVNTLRQMASVISFPRDLYLPIPGWKTERINAAFPHGGFDALANTLEENFSVRPSHYVLASFSSFRNIVDRLNGIDVYAASSLTDRCDLPQARRGSCTVQAGLNHMNGATALWYVRSRRTSSDLDRTRRAQEVLLGIFTRILSTRVQDWSSLFDVYQGAVETNLAFADVAPLLPTAARVYNNQGLIQRYALTLNEVTPYTTDTGAQVLLPNYDAIMALLDQAIFKP